MFPGLLGFPQTAGPPRNVHTWEADFELPVRAAREAIMGLGAVRDVSVDVMIAAMADVVGDAAARLDLVQGSSTLEEALSRFLGRVERTYKRRKLELGKQPVKEVQTRALTEMLNRGKHAGKRNEPCPCGSGRKFKKCCMAKVRETAFGGRS